ncbi:MAG: type II toxin-antitoxin system RelE/ParE family toxin [Spirochaetales bacterium]|nr:type II toxin-antitoxin system RelE/ParE family toxin [Spirochaetales bacterium]
MSWTLKTSTVYISDVAETFSYIADELENKPAAERLSETIDKKTELIADNPFIHAVVDDAYLAYFGIRLCVIKNYLLFYIADEDKNTVYILRFLYARRNWTDILKNDFQNKIFFKFI